MTRLSPARIRKTLAPTQAHLPGLADGEDFLYRAQERGLTVAPGTLFSPSGRFGDYVRLAASLPAGSPVEETARLLGEIAREMA